MKTAVFADVFDRQLFAVLVTKDRFVLSPVILKGSFYVLHKGDDIKIYKENYYAYNTFKNRSPGGKINAFEYVVVGQIKTESEPKEKKRANTTPITEAKLLTRQKRMPFFLFFLLLFALVIKSGTEVPSFFSLFNGLSRRFFRIRPPPLRQVRFFRPTS